jgi:hypothetical protein
VPDFLDVPPLGWHDDCFGACHLLSSTKLIASISLAAGPPSNWTFKKGD